MSAVAEIDKVQKTFDCPHCKGKVDVEIERKVPKIVFQEESTQKMQQKIEEKSLEQPKKLTHDELATFIPKGINSMKCPGGDCGHQKIKNPKQTKKYKSCPHCSANTLPKGSDSCPYCSKNIDEDQELDDGIELESEEEDE